MRPTTLRARLTTWYTLLLGAPLVVLCFVAYAVFAGSLTSGTDRFIGDALTAVSREVTAERRVAETTPVALQTTLNEVRFRDLHLVVFDDKHKVIASSAVSTRSEPEDLPKLHELDSVVARRLASQATGDTTAFTIGNLSQRVVSHPLDVGTTTYRIAGAYSLEYNERVLSLIRNLFLLAVPLLMLFAAIGGWFIADRGLKPLGAMASRAAEISTKTLHERLPVDGGAELVKLSTVVNSLLDRIEHSFDEQRRFVADASHELRTPAAIVRTETEVTLAREHREEAEYRESFAIVRDATQRLTRIVDDLFMLARSDAGGIVPRRDVVYLDELMEDTVRAVRSVAEKRGVRVVITRMDDATVAGDADLLGRLILNLVDNAIKYSPNGSTVETAITRGGSDVRLDVIDQGPGIPEEARARIFERFFRVDTARLRDHAVSRHTSGAGLGLAIARRIAEMHEGTLELAESRPGRTRFTFVMPLSSRA